MPLKNSAWDPSRAQFLRQAGRSEEQDGVAGRPPSSAGLPLARPPEANGDCGDSDLFATLPTPSAGLATFAPPATGVTTGANSLVSVRVRASGLTEALELTSRGEMGGLTENEIRTVQAVALHVVQDLFRNERGTDAALKHHVGMKQAAYGEIPAAQLATHLAAREGTRKQQAAALGVILHTFRSPGDEALRMEAYTKLAKIGDLADLARLMPLVRKGDDVDLYHGMDAVRRITERHGPPIARDGLQDDPEFGPLLKQDSLSPAEEARLVEAVLERGKIVAAKRHGGMNKNEVWFVTFAESVPDGRGGRRAIQGVVKPEKTWPGKEKAFFTRDESAYLFDKCFTKTGLVPAATASLIPDALLGGGSKKACRVCSVQLRVPDSRPIGAPQTGDHPTPDRFDEMFDEYRKTAGYQVQASQVRTLMYLLNDPDKFANDVLGANLQNILVQMPDPDDQSTWRLKMIDLSYSQGAPAGRVRSSVLDGNDGAINNELSAHEPSSVENALAALIEPADASDVAARVNFLQGRKADG